MHNIAQVVDIDLLLENASDESSAKTKREKKVVEKMYNALVEGRCPLSESYTVKNHRMVLNKWATLTQIDWFRDYLQDGLPAHIAENELLQQIFCVDPTSLSSQPQKLSATEKRAAKSKNSDSSKERTRNRRKNQRNILNGE